MRYFIDTEFNETGETIVLISIGIVDQYGRTYYAESSEFVASECQPWVQENVISKLGLAKDRKSRNDIRAEIENFFHGDGDIEIWGYYADYDWVVFCWLWGAMIDLPRGFPKYCMDLQQWWKMLGKPDIKPPDPVDEHNALADAKWNQGLWTALARFERSISVKNVYDGID